MRYLIGFTCVLALAVMGCSEKPATDGDLGGFVWCEMALGSWDTATAVSFPDPLIGTYVGEIFRSTDGGMSWTRQEAPAGSGLYADVVFTDVNTGTIVGSEGTMQQVQTIDERGRIAKPACLTFRRV